MSNWSKKAEAALPDGRAVLHNARYERFAQGLVRGKTQHEAYIWAGFSQGRKPEQVRSEASKLSRRPEIAARVVYLQGRQAQRIGVTVDALVQELDDMLKLAKRVKHPAAGVGAILAKGKLLGLIVDRPDAEAALRKPSREPTDIKTMPLDEWQKKFAPPEGPLQ